jgi:hypothetical protein
MPREKIRNIGFSERPWALNKQLQGFTGRFYLDADTGIYFQQGTPEEDIAKIKRALAGVPQILRDNAVELGVTMSTTPYLTRMGNSSTTYADWRRKGTPWVSPHIEIGGNSLDGELAAHLVHEFSHLFFDNLSTQMQDLWIEMLAESAHDSLFEVTRYAQSYFVEWRGTLKLPNNASYRQAHQLSSLRTYAKEAFCETAAVLSHPSYRDGRCNVDLPLRRRTMVKMGLQSARLSKSA